MPLHQSEQFLFSGQGDCRIRHRVLRRRRKSIADRPGVQTTGLEHGPAQMLRHAAGLKIVFTGSSVMRLKTENPELNGLVKSYNLRGFSFREFLNLQTGNDFPSYTLDEILNCHEQIVRSILPKASPLKFFQDYLHHGFYPFFLEKRNFSENLAQRP